MLTDLRLRLQGSQEQERAARTEARRLAHELTVTRRLLAFAYGAEAPARTVDRQPPPGEVPRVQAVSLRAGVLFNLESCQSNGRQVVLAGWAFMPTPAWNGLTGTVTVLFRQAGESYAAATGRVFRPDVAAHFAAQPAETLGGAKALASVGFASEVAVESLPAGVDLEVVLRLECAGLACEQPTGRHVRL